MFEARVQPRDKAPTPRDLKPDDAADSTDPLYLLERVLAGVKLYKIPTFTRLDFLTPQEHKEFVMMKDDLVNNWHGGGAKKRSGRRFRPRMELSPNQIKVLQNSVEVQAILRWMNEILGK